jgi:ABC-type branched-subunit amino acid transport system substrate-binding protein
MAKFLRRLLLTAVVIHGAAGSVAQDTSADEPVVIGVLVPPDETEALSLRQGATLGVEHANRSGTSPARVVIRGRDGPWGSDATEAARLITEDGARGLVAPASGAATHLVLQVAGRTAVPVVSLCADTSVTQTGVPWMVRIVPRTIDEARALFSGIGRSGSGRALRWVAVVPAGRAGREKTRDLVAAASAVGCSLGKPVELDSRTTGLANLQNKLLATQPDAVLLWLDPVPAGRLARSLRDAGFRGVLAGPEHLDTAEFVTAAGTAAGDFVIPALASGIAESDACRKFAAAYRQRFGNEPDWTAAMAYDAATLLLRLVRDPGPRPARSSFPIVKARRGATGPLSFDRNGNRLVTLRLTRPHAGRVVEEGVTARGITESFQD